MLLDFQTTVLLVAVSIVTMLSVITLTTTTTDNGQRPTAREKGARSE